jgi:hypothetical protein
MKRSASLPSAAMQVYPLAIAQVGINVLGMGYTRVRVKLFKDWMTTPSAT